jgi:glycine cleavage system H protein
MSYPSNLRYTKDHEWLAVEGERGKIGITEYAQKQLGDVVYVELPAAGTKISAGQSFGTIESVKAVSELFAPVSGEVVDVNTSVKDKPELVNSDPHGSWLIAVKLTKPDESGGLLDASQYADLVK